MELLYNDIALLFTFFLSFPLLYIFVRLNNKINKIKINNKINYTFGNNLIFNDRGFNDSNDVDSIGKISIQINTKNTIYKYLSCRSILKINLDMDDIKLNKHYNFLDLYLKNNDRAQNVLYMYDYDIDIDKIPCRENIKNIFDYKGFTEENRKNEINFDVIASNNDYYKYFEKLLNDSDKKLISVYVYGEPNTGKTHFIKNIFSILEKIRLKKETEYIQIISSFYIDLKWMYFYQNRNICPIYIVYDAENKEYNKRIINEIFKMKSHINNKIILIIEGYEENEYDLNMSYIDILVKTRNLTVQEIKSFAEYYYKQSINIERLNIKLDYKFTPRYISKMLLENETIDDFYLSVNKI